MSNVPNVNNVPNVVMLLYSDSIQILFLNTASESVNVSNVGNVDDLRALSTYITYITNIQTF